MTATRTPIEERVNGLLPAIAERAEETESERRVPAKNIAELTEAGVFRLWVPKRYGGEESAVLPGYAAIEGLGRSCPSTAWVTSLLAVHSWLVAMFDERVQDEVWGDSPDTLVASSLAPSGEARHVEGGFVLNGSWPFSSGIDHCSWTVPSALVPDSDPDQPKVGHLFLVPASDYSIVDDWHVSGLRGTGSKSFVLDEVFVPEYRGQASQLTFGGELAAGRRVNTGPLYNWAWGPLFTYVFVPPAIGAAVEAVERFRTYMVSRRAPFTGAAFSEKSPSWLRLSHAAAEVDAARLTCIATLERSTNARLPASRSRRPSSSGRRLAPRFAWNWRAGLSTVCSVEAAGGPFRTATHSSDSSATCTPSPNTRPRTSTSRPNVTARR